MSIDIGIVIKKDKKKKVIIISEKNLSTGQIKKVKTCKNAKEALVYLEENNIGYETIEVKGFSSYK